MVHIFIVNPYAGRKTFADDLRSKLENMDNLNYFIFNTRYKGNEIDLVKLINDTFEGEKLRFYCCGGSGTMRNIMNGFKNFDDVEIAWYPCGNTNDFLKIFGKQKERFKLIEELIHGEVFPVDYIKSNYGVCLNTISLGKDAIALKKESDYKIFDMYEKGIPLKLGIIYSLFLTRSVEYEIVINNHVYSNNVSELIFGNGRVLGGDIFFSEKTDILDGDAEFFMAQNSGIKAIKVLSAMQKKDFKTLQSISTLGNTPFIHIRRKDGRDFSINQDGELIHVEEELEAHIVKKGLKLIVPRGVTLEEQKGVKLIGG